MKANELGAKDGDYIVRSNESPFAYRVFGGDELTIVWSDEDCRLQDLPHSNWQLLQPRPELGEPVAKSQWFLDEKYLVLDPDCGLCEGRVRPDSGGLWYIDNDGFLFSVEKQVVYRDSRPLPALPKRELTLREKILAVLDGTSILPGTKAAMATELAALLENHDE